MNQPLKVKEVVSLYMALRDKKAEIKREYDEKVATIEGDMEKIENALLDLMQSNGLDSIKTEAGTAYVTKRTSVTAADKDLFMTFCRTNDEWTLLEVRPSKQAVEQYLEEYQELPPGLNYRVERVVNVRKS